MPSLSGPDRSKDTPAKVANSSRGLSESLEDAPVARRELTTALPPPAPVRHTPGPWITTKHAVILDQHQREIAQVHNVYDQEGNYQGHNNAHLIAAAPDLLRMLKHSLAALQSHHADLNTTNRLMLTDIKVLIAKAEAK